MDWYDRREPWSKQSEDARDAGDIDYARVIHSASFRRLQGKTQLLNLGDSDFYRTRLTHSLEVAQIAPGLVKQIVKYNTGKPVIDHLPDRSLMQAIGCTHDLGHPPFGHGGEAALNYCMRDHGGFEGNGQTLRILSRLESFSASAGSNLCRRTLLGVLKYPASFRATNNLSPQLDTTTTAVALIDPRKSKPPKCFLDSEQDVVRWILEPLDTIERDEFQSVELRTGEHHRPKHKSLDCSIMDVADDISYGVHDLEDAIALKLLSRAQFESAVPADRCASFLDALKEKYRDECGNNVYDHFVGMLFGESAKRKRCISRLIHHFMTAVEVVENDIFSEPLLRFRIQVKDRQNLTLMALHCLVRNEVILNPSVQQLEFKGQKMVVSVFEAMSSHPKRLLPRDAMERMQRNDEGYRVICDYIAGMTDNYLLKTYERLFSPRMGSVFDRI